jgi:hypothetical protein
MRALILSGGSEIVATALADEFLETGIPFSIVALGKKGLFTTRRVDIPFYELSWSPASPEETIHALERLLQSEGATPASPWIIFPTEDGGLRLLLEYGHRLAGLGHFSRAMSLPLGGLDKAELFSHLLANHCEDIIAQTRIATSPDEILPAIDDLGGDCVIKPALKPLSMHLVGMKSKAFFSSDYTTKEELLADIKKSWRISREWIVQKRLITPSEGEAVYWAVRDARGIVRGMAARERWKYPRAGGTGCWVTTDSALVQELHPLAERILSALDFQGLCELAFLLDAEGHWRLLELNLRPWLQVGLAHTAGAHLATQAAWVLAGKESEPVEARHGVSWVNIERLLLAAFSGEYGSLPSVLKTAFYAWKQADTLAIWSSRIPGIKYRWIRKMIGKGLGLLQS